MMEQVDWAEMSSRLKLFVGNKGLALLHGGEIMVTILEARPPVSEDFVLDWFTFFEDSLFTVAREDGVMTAGGAYIHIKGESFSTLEGAPILPHFEPEGGENTAAPVVDLERNGDQE